MQITSFTGFVRGDNATLTLRGTSGAGFQTTWCYQLRREDGVWKIIREYWDTREIR